MEEDDFGFSVITEEDYINQNMPEYVTDMSELEKLIVPFLDKLLIDSDKPLIKWPNRKEIIESQKNKILSITRKYNGK